MIIENEVKELNFKSNLIYTKIDKNLNSYCFINENLILSINLKTKNLLLLNNVKQANILDVKEYYEAINISEYLNYLKNSLKEDQNKEIYKDILKEFKEKFPSYIYEYEMIKKKSNELSFKAETKKEKIKLN